jgi:hypothetical protein
VPKTSLDAPLSKSPSWSGLTASTVSGMVQPFLRSAHVCYANVAWRVIAVVLRQNAHDAQLRTHTRSYMPHSSEHTAPAKCTRARPSTAAAWSSCSPRAQQRRPLHCFLQLPPGQQDCRCAVVDVAARVCSKP